MLNHIVHFTKYYYFDGIKEYEIRGTCSTNKQNFSLESWLMLYGIWTEGSELGSVWDNYFSFRHRVETRSGANPTCSVAGTGGNVQGRKAGETRSWPVTFIWCRWSFAFTHSYVIMACYLTIWAVLPSTFYILTSIICLHNLSILHLHIVSLMFGTVDKLQWEWISGELLRLFSGFLCLSRLE